jgi:deoxyribodipyrimidine photolyase
MSVTDQDAPAIVWFRDDLRLHDQPALAAATGNPRYCVYHRYDVPFKFTGKINKLTFKLGPDQAAEAKP